MSVDGFFAANHLVFCRVAQELTQSIARLNVVRDSQLNQGDPAVQMERTLDNQLNALSDVNRKCQNMELQIEALGIRI